MKFQQQEKIVNLVMLKYLLVNGIKMRKRKAQKAMKVAPFSAKAKGLFLLPFLGLRLPFTPAFPTLNAKERAFLVSTCFNQGQAEQRNAFNFTGVGQNMCLCPAAVLLSLQMVSDTLHLQIHNSTQSLHEGWPLHHNQQHVYNHM